MKPQNIAIIGAGLEAAAAANYFAKQATISVYDDRHKRQIEPEYFNKLATGVSFYFGKPIETKVDIVIRSPGVRPDHPQILKLARSGAKITSSTNIFFEKSPAKIVAVTGTKGKGTTATLIYEILKIAKKDVYLAGNIGTPALDILSKLDHHSIAVLELSSFQLIDLAHSPHIAVVLMITSEHLDWHTKVAEYQRAKLAIVKYQKPNDFAVINQDFTPSRDFAKQTKAKVYFTSTKNQTNGVYNQNGNLISEINGLEKICETEKVLLPGQHNLQNVAAATAVAKILNLDTDNIVKVLTSFKGLIHRLQQVQVVYGVKYYNDSFSTIPETTMAAIEAFTNPKILILGGSSKKSDFTHLGLKIKNDSTIKAIILIGDETFRIKEAIAGFKGQILQGAKSMPEIVKLASSIAQSGDIVLLSPACASFDMFKNYKDRGNQFINEVKKII